MPKALELNIPLDSCGGLDLQSTLICHYIWVCSCLECAARMQHGVRLHPLGAGPAQHLGVQSCAFSISIPIQERAEGMWQVAEGRSWRAAARAVSREKRGLRAPTLNPVQMPGGVCVGWSGGKDKVQRVWNTSYRMQTVTGATVNLC